MGVQPDGKILVAGRTGTYPSPDDFSLVRYNSNGSLDTTFGNAGAVKTDLGSTIEGVSDIVVQPDGKILVVGYTIVVSSSRWDYALVRYNIDGSLDTSFSGDGKVTIAVGPTGNSGVLESVKLQADGKILVAGSSGSSGKMDFTVVRLNTDGSVDITFDAGIDTTAPTVTTFSPADDAANISIRSNIYVTFNEAINKGAGNIVLKTAAGATVATYDAATSTNLSFSGSTLTINPTADLSYSTGYKVEFAAGTIKDLSGNSYAGTTSYNFTTGTTDKGSESKDLVFVFKSEKVGAGVNPASYSYFYTVNPDEAAFVRAQANWPWVEKTASFEAAHSNPSDSVSVFRFRSDKHQSHFFTINAAEKAQIIDWSSTGTNGYDWKYEGENFKVYTSATPTDALGKAAIPVYRVWMDDKDFNAANGVSGGHYFTANKVDYDAMVKLVGVVGEGVAFYGEVPGA